MGLYISQTSLLKHYIVYVGLYLVKDQFVSSGPVEPRKLLNFQNALGTHANVPVQSYSYEHVLCRLACAVVYPIDMDASTTPKPCDEYEVIGGAFCGVGLFPS